jgi:hypothetical protein
VSGIRKGRSCSYTYKCGRHDERTVLEFSMCGAERETGGPRCQGILRLVKPDTTIICDRCQRKATTAALKLFVAAGHLPVGYIDSTGLPAIDLCEICTALLDDWLKSGKPALGANGAAG